MSAPGPVTGAGGAAAKGWWPAHRWLVLRRLSQASFLGLFLLGPLAGIWLVEGNLASSRTLDLLPLSDPYILLQSLFAGHLPHATALIGGAIVLAAYTLIGGRMYCSWVCPVNVVTDGAHWLRQRLGIRKGWQPSRASRLWLLGMTLVVSAATGTIAWEAVNPVTMLYRGLVFGMGLAWTIVAAVFLFDLVVSRRGWCGHLCPVGAFWGLIGSASLLRISAAGRARCNNCMDCFAVCPEPQVITPALKGAATAAAPDAATGAGPAILAGDCTNCGRCIDVCSLDVFRFATRFDRRTDGVAGARGQTWGTTP